MVKILLGLCNKYRFYSLSPSSLPNFLNKLKEKKQTGIQQKQAYEAIHLFYEFVGQQPNIKNVLASIKRDVKGDILSYPCQAKKLLF